jgi:predicted phage baseplate assembly protein
VTATYRTGLGPAGNVAAGALMLLFNPPLGVRTVSNLIAAQGGVAPEALEDARAGAPRAVHALGRVVTLSDYESFAADYAGVGKAQATALEFDDQPFVEVTVAAPDGSTPPDTTGLSNAIAAAVDPAQLQVFEVNLCRPAYFAVTAWLTFAAGADTAAVTAAAQAALQSTFGFAARGFGQSVRAVEVIVALQGVPGVLGVQLLAFYRLDAGPGVTLPTVLTADPSDVTLIPPP